MPKLERYNNDIDPELDLIKAYYSSLSATPSNTSIIYLKLNGYLFKLSKIKDTDHHSQIYNLFPYYEDLDEATNELFGQLTVNSNNIRENDEEMEDYDYWLIDSPSSINEVKNWLEEQYGFTELTFNGIRIGDFIVGKNNTNKPIYGIVTTFDFRDGELIGIRTSGYALNLKDLVLGIYSINYVYRISRHYAFVIGFEFSTQLFKNKNIKQNIYFEGNTNPDSPIVFDVTYENKKCAIDNKTRLVGNIDYSTLANSPTKKTTLFSTEELIPYMYEYFPFYISKKRKTIAIKAGETTLRLVNNKKYPQLQIGKSYLVENYLNNKRSSKAKVIVSENNQQFSVPLDRFKVPFIPKPIKMVSKNSDNIKKQKDF